METDLENIYILPMILKPGVHNFFIFQEDDEGEIKQYYNRHIGPVRKEPIPEFAKELDYGKKAREFELSLSVFKDWIPDTEGRIKACLMHDSKYWKLDGLDSWDKDSVERIKTVIYDNWDKLHEIIVMLSVRGQFPTISLPLWRKICSETNIFDENITKNNIESFFYGPNFD